jgi:hypothetical protein
MNFNSSLTKFKDWFEERNLREKLLVCALSWAAIYATFSFILFYPIDSVRATLHTQIKATRSDITNWQTQLKFLKEIPNTQIYKDWVKQHQNYSTLKDKYKHMIGQQDNNQWDNIISTVLQEFPNITVEKIGNGAETSFISAKIQSMPDTLYQQKMTVIVLGNFDDIVSYLSSLEKAMPNIHWDTLNYEVTVYPLARVAMEFSVLYEKPKI